MAVAVPTGRGRVIVLLCGLMVAAGIAWWTLQNESMPPTEGQANVTAPWGMELDLRAPPPSPAPLPEAQVDLDRLAAFLPGFRRATLAACRMPDEPARTVAASDKLLFELDAAINLCTADAEIVAMVRDARGANATVAQETAQRSLARAQQAIAATLTALQGAPPTGTMADAEARAGLQDRFFFARFLLAQASRDHAASINHSASAPMVVRNAAWSAATAATVERFVEAYEWAPSVCAPDGVALGKRASERLTRAFELGAIWGNPAERGQYYGLYGSLFERIGPRLNESIALGWWPEVARLDMELGWTVATWENMTSRPLPLVEEARWLERAAEAETHTLTSHFLLQSYAIDPLLFDVEWQRQPERAAHSLALGALDDSFARLNCPS